MTATTTTRIGPPPAGVPTAPPLPEDVHALLRRLRMPHTRAAAPDVLATARAQRWERRFGAPVPGHRRARRHPIDLTNLPNHERGVPRQ